MQKCFRGKLSARTKASSCKSVFVQFYLHAILYARAKWWLCYNYDTTYNYDSYPVNLLYHWSKNKTQSNATFFHCALKTTSVERYLAGISVRKRIPRFRLSHRWASSAGHIQSCNQKCIGKWLRCRSTVRLLRSWMKRSNPRVRLLAGFHTLTLLQRW